MASQTYAAPTAGPAAQNLAAQLQGWMVNQFQGTTYQPNALDVQHEPIYDRSWNSATSAPWAAAAVIPAPTQFFTAPQNKTLADTNVTTAKRLDAPQAFAVMGIGFRYASNTLLADVILMENSFVLEFWIGEKSYNRGPLYFYPVGGGPTGFAATTVATTSIQAITNGMPGKFNRHELGVNIVIDNQASFYGQLTGTAVTLTASGSGGLGMNMQLVLDGLHARGVQ
jgi:hypothetical protein